MFEALKKRIKEEWRKFLCWRQHDWRIDGHVEPVESVPGCYTYKRYCSRKGCGLHQNISICDMGEFFGKLHFLDKEWTENET